MSQRVAPSLPKSLVAGLAAAALALVLLLPTARGEEYPVFWTSPTPADQTKFTVPMGKDVSITLAAATSVSLAAVHIQPLSSIPKGARFNSADGGVAKASFHWTPKKLGDYIVEFQASSVEVSAPTLRFVIHVVPYEYSLANEKVARWGFVLKRAVVRAQPKAAARVVTTLATATGDDTQNLVLAIEGVDRSPTETWYRVRLPILPNNTTGWVRAGYLSKLQTTRTHLYIDRARKTAILKRSGVTVFKTGVGVGLPYWPTPQGEFYIRSKLTNFNDPFYGPIAFGTNARSAVLTDWPGGGFVGIHGTSLPQIIPGAVSHGCVRMVNSAIVRLARLMSIGTPLTIS